MSNEWDNEPNEKQFTAHGLNCLIVRHPSMKHWCGYVAVSSEHPLFGVTYNDGVKPPAELLTREFDIDRVGAINVFCATRRDEPLEDICDLCLLTDVHGGLTWSAERLPQGKPDGRWWFGFDCSHAGDLSPGMTTYMSDIDGEYRNIKYAESECRDLARQLANWRTDQPEP